MKKSILLTVMTAGAMTLSSCSPKKTPVETVPEATEETAADDTFLELTEADFSDVDLQLTVTDSAPPLDIHSIEMESLDFGERLCPCKAEDVRMDHRTCHSDDPEIEQMLIEQFNQECETPNKGDITSIAADGEKIYFSVNFDNIDFSHCCSVFAFDTQSGEMRELLSRESLDEDCTISSLSFVHGMLLYCGYSGEYSGSGELQHIGTVYRIDTETGEVSELFSGHFMELVPALGDSFVVYDIIYHENSDTHDFNLYRYDFESGKLIETDHWEDTPAILYPCYDGIAVLSDEGNGKLSIKTSGYRLTTELPFEGYAFSIMEDKVSIVAHSGLVGITDYILYTYDLRTHERYITNINGLGRNIHFSGGLLISSSSGNSQWKTPAYIMIPELGTAFVVSRSEAADIYTSGSFSAIQSYNETEQYGQLLWLNYP